MLSEDAVYAGVDVEGARDFGMRKRVDITYYDGSALPFGDASFDHVLCTEVLEHVPDPALFLADISRILRPGGSLILTVPWSARLHHAPHDYTRFTKFALDLRLRAAGFNSIVIEERGNDIAAIANKLLVITVRLLRPAKWYRYAWTFVVALALAPFTVGAVLAAHVAMLLNLGSKDDPLGYGVVAVKSLPAGRA